MADPVRSLTRVVVVRLYLSVDVARVEFDQKLELRLDCDICKRTNRTVVLSPEESQSYCMKTGHQYHGQITGMSIREEGRSRGFLIYATYGAEYKFSSFRDAKYGRLEQPYPYPLWSRVGFTLFCSCGRQKHISVQPNRERPSTTRCDCGNPLFYDVDEIPQIRAPEEVEGGLPKGFCWDLQFVHRKELTAADDSPSLDVVLVHGTWGRGFFSPASQPKSQRRRWFEEGSTFRRRLEASLKDRLGHVTIREFHWSGHNSFFARERASVDLADRLDRTKTRSLMATCLIVCHSHGGNVALRAVQRLSNLGSRIDHLNIVTMGTPFIRIKDNPRLTDYTSWSRFFLASLIASEVLFQYPLWHWWTVGTVWLLHAIIFGLLLGGLDNVVIGLHPVEPVTQERLRSIREATFFPSALYTNTLVLRCANDEAALAIAAGVIGEQLSRFALATNSWIAQRLGVRGKWLFLTASFIGVVSTLSKSSNYAILSGSGFRTWWILGLGFFVSFYILEIFSTVLSGVCKSVFGKELLLQSEILEASAESTPDSHAKVTVRTFPTINIRKSISLAMDYEFNGEKMGRAGLMHSVYEEPECAPFIAEWIVDRIRTTVVNRSSGAPPV